MLTLASLALAQTSVIDDNVLSATALFPEGFGSPSVVWDTAGTQFRMYAETQITPPAGCTEAWAIVESLSSDGLTWSAPTSFQGNTALFPCGARRPSAVWTDAGAYAVMFEVVGTTPQEIGSTTNVTGSVVRRKHASLSGLSEPSITRYDGKWNVFAVSGLNVVQATTARGVLNNTFTISATPVLYPGAIYFFAGGAFHPSFSCYDSAVWPYSFGFAGEDSRNGALTWSTGAVRAGVGAYVDTTSEALTDWDDLDVIDDGSSLAVWFEHIDAGTGLPVIGVAGVIPNGAYEDRDCTP